MALGSTHPVSPSGLTLNSLPTENLMAIFSFTSTQSLIKLSMVCHRFHAVALRILKPRLRAAALREDLKIQLLCTPPGIDTRVFCSYSGTDEPKDNRVSGLYARFRPEAYSPNGSPLVPQDQRLSVRQVALEDFEHFCQLQTKVDLALAHGRAYIAPSFNLHRDFIRVRREWLEKQTGSNIMWIDANEGVGLRVRPHAKGTGKPPNVDYNLDIEELIIRGTRLLETVDEAAAKQDDPDVITLQA